MLTQNKQELIYEFGPDNLKCVLSSNELRQIVLSLRAIEHEHRKKIVELLCSNEQMTVTQIYVKLRIEQSVASQHLAILRKHNIVETTRNGKYIYYSNNYAQLEKIGALVEHLASA